MIDPRGEDADMVMQSVAWAQGTSTSSGGGLGSVLVQFGVIPLLIVVFYFLIIRPQQQAQKKQAEMRGALKKGDKIITASGIWGTISNLGKDTVTLQIADNTKIKIQREQIARVRGEEEE